MANTTSDKLARMEETKATLTENLIEKGIDVPDSTTFLERAALVREIQCKSTEFVTINIEGTTTYEFADFEGFIVKTENGIELLKEFVGGTKLKVEKGSIAVLNLDESARVVPELDDMVVNGYYGIGINSKFGTMCHTYIGTINSDKTFIMH